MTEQSNETPKQIRCAVYTRVSTNDNLEKDFTSLDAQRESAESYILSQKNQGWTLISERYDDAGFTGANTDRPALKSLIEHIKGKEIDCVVVYKVDRLSRSLLDFTQLLEFFDKSAVTFVSVTQHFNTNSSMGRLTLNILLSFAQFEREMISERTMDKMAAARRKGKFIGGRPAIGYDLDKEKHELIVNPKEAEIVHKIFDLYLKEKSCLAVTKILNKQGLQTKSHTTNNKTTGGKMFKSTNVNWVLKNVLYIGKVEYKGTIYMGVHPPIMSENTFNKAQALLEDNRRKPHGKQRTKGKGLLSGIFRCNNCQCSMCYTYTVKRKTKYIFYVCLNAIKRGYDMCPTKSVKAPIAESAIIECLKKIPSSKIFPPPNWETLPHQKKREIIVGLTSQIIYDGKTKILTINCNQDGKAYDFNVELKQAKPEKPEESIKREPQLRQNLVLVHQVQSVLDKGQAKTPKQVAEWLNLSQARLNQFMNMLFLAPVIQEEILFAEDDKITAIPEYRINEISREMCWKKQLGMWEKLKKH